MSKIYSEGKRFSKRKVIEYKTTDELEELKKDAQWIEPIPRSFENYIFCFRNGAENILEESGLPSAPLMYRCRSGSWRPAYKIFPTGGRIPQMSEIRKIDGYIRDMGFERDKAEDIAARIISKIYDLEQADNQEEALTLAIELGMDAALGHAYGIQSLEQTKGGKLSSRSRPWVDEFVKMAIEEFPGLSAKEVWDNIPSRDENTDAEFYLPSGWVAYKGQVNGIEKVLAYNDKTGQSDSYELPFSTFKNKFYKFKK